MFRVPTDELAPTFDHVESISFWRWLTSSAVERKHWQSLRNRAARAAAENQVARWKEAHPDPRRR